MKIYVHAKYKMLLNRAYQRILHNFLYTSTYSRFQLPKSSLTKAVRLSSVSCHYCRHNTVKIEWSGVLNQARKYSTMNTRQQLHGGGQKRHTTVVMYISAMGIAMVGTAYAGVPLYRMFCAAVGIGGQTTTSHDTSGKIVDLQVVEDRELTVKFNADVASSMQWNFRPQQCEIKVLPGETALAFYTAKNPTEKPIIGISTYTVIPYDAAQYFNKIQCFCFEEQILNPHEEVDMPVFFYIDPEYAQDPRLEYINEILLSYTFFEAKEGMSLPLPGFPVKGHGR